MRFGPLIVAITGAALILLEVRRFAEGGVSIFWIVVGALAIALGVVGHVQGKRQSRKRSDDRTLPPLDRL
ncbi:MAG: hypothetical protein WBD40_06835 [Tepidisphaeraceae bacterium]